MSCCSICFDNIENTLYFTNCECSAVYHATCLDKWYEKKHSCPTCRKKYISKPILNKKDNTEPLINQFERSIYMTNYNILRIMSGMRGLSYNN